jgi:UDP-GlcNAc3NAcA epimerase
MNTSTDKLRWISVVGARPQFMKLAPLCNAISAYNNSGRVQEIEHVIVHTGQHYDREMAALFFEELHIPEPAVNLAVGSGSHATQLARMLERLEAVLTAEQVSRVIIYGDTNSTLAGALVAARLGLPLAHVEAGCRSHDMQMPEEQNRILADHLSDLLLAASQTAVQNLHAEGIGAESDPKNRSVVFVGDPMRDALLANVRVAEGRTEDMLHKHSLRSGEYYLLTLHRAENTEYPQRLGSVLHTLGSVDLPVLFPVHPRTRHAMEQAGVIVDSNVRLISPLGYLEMLVAERHARKILTDSGGVQKEAFYLDVPCITLRDRTEWPETVAAGANRLAGLDSRRILDCLHADYAPITDAYCFGDGHAGEHILAALLAAQAQNRYTLSTFADVRAA